MYDLPGLPPAVCIHEAAHACVARHLGLPVIAVLAARDGSGMCLIAHGDGPEELVAAAMTTAAGIAFYRMAGYDTGTCDDDAERIHELRARYREATGHEMADPFAAAWAIINPAEQARELLAIAWAMREGVVYSGAELFALAGAETPVPVADIGVGVGIGGKGGTKPVEVSVESMEVPMPFAWGLGCTLSQVPLQATVGQSSLDKALAFLGSS